jgi:hypothetical protein
LKTVTVEMMRAARTGAALITQGWSLFPLSSHHLGQDFRYLLDKVRFADDAADAVRTVSDMIGSLL